MVKFILRAVLVAAAAAAVENLPDVARYFRIREM